MSFSIYRRKLYTALLGVFMLVFMSIAPTHARPSLVVDVETGTVLHENEAFTPWYPASLTKMMTAYTAFSAMRAGRMTPQSLLRVSALASRQKPSKMGFKPGTQVTLDAALHIIFVKSANDVSLTIAEGVSGSVEAFVAEMNGHARRLGMRGSNWRNPNGMPDPQQMTTAHDMAVLARALYREFPQYAGYFRQAGIAINGKVMRNYNALIGRFPGADGLKTGFICASGFNLVGSATRHGQRHVAIVFGAASARDRAEKAAQLLEASFATPQNRGSLSALRRPNSTPHSPVDLRSEICSSKRGRSLASEAEDLNAPSAAYTPAQGSENPNLDIFSSFEPKRSASHTPPNPARHSFLQPLNINQRPLILEIDKARPKDGVPMRVRVAGTIIPNTTPPPTQAPPVPAPAIAKTTAAPMQRTAPLSPMAGASLHARTKTAAQIQPPTVSHLKTQTVSTQGAGLRPKNHPPELRSSLDSATTKASGAPMQLQPPAKSAKKAAPPIKKKAKKTADKKREAS